MTVENAELRIGAQNLVLETGKYAKQADGSVVVKYGGTVVLVTVCVSQKPKDLGFFPLFVEYQEKTYAAGRIPGGFFKREGRPSESEILASRLIDRPIRPLFPKGFLHEVQIMGIVLSSDGEYDPDILAINGASCVLSMSQAPFGGPVGAVRIARVNNELILFPSYKQREEGDLDLVVVGTSEGIIMLEGTAKQVEEEVVLEAIELGFKQLQDLIKLQEGLAKKCAKQKMAFESKDVSEDILKKVKDSSLNKIKEISQTDSKEKREEVTLNLQKELEEKFVTEDDEDTKKEISSAIEKILKEQIRESITNGNKRVDSRKFDEIRSISCEVGALPRTHGSAVFTRGQTQSLCIATLGTRSDQQMVEALEGESHKSFMLHYSFPPFSVGEIKPVRGPGRREIGHGALAEKSLLNVMPDKEQFPYTVRVVSEILESNGSSSMATVCAATLCLMDAGVPIATPVAGVALGLVKEDKKYAILTDLNGLEDHYGDMDFKVAGTKKGINVIQMDLKISCVDLELLKKAFAQSKDARMVILDKMANAISSPREEISEFAPRIIRLQIKPEKIGELIGPGGKTIRKIIETTNVTVDIEDDGSVLVASTEKENTDKAIELINAITQDIEVGKIYDAKVKRITNFGAFCEIAPGKDGLVHVSELSNKYVKNVGDVIKLGDEFKVKVIEIDELKRINLSKKQVDQPSQDADNSSKE